MNTEDIRVFVRRGAEVTNRHDLRGLDEFYAPDFLHRRAPGGKGHDLEDLKRFYRELFAAFPDWTFVADEVIVEADKVAVVWTMRGTHTGMWQDLAPTGKQVVNSAITFYRLRDRKIVESDCVWAQDVRAMLLQQSIDPVPIPRPK